MMMRIKKRIITFLNKNKICFKFVVKTGPNSYCIVKEDSVDNINIKIVSTEPITKMHLKAALESYFVNLDLTPKEFSHQASFFSEIRLQSSNSIQLISHTKTVTYYIQDNIATRDSLSISYLTLENHGNKCKGSSLLLDYRTVAFSHLEELSMLRTLTKGLS